MYDVDRVILPRKLVNTAGLGAVIEPCRRVFGVGVVINGTASRSCSNSCRVAVVVPPLGAEAVEPASYDQDVGSTPSRGIQNR